MPQCLTLTNPAALKKSGAQASRPQRLKVGSQVITLGKKPRNVVIPTHSYCKHVLMHCIFRFMYHYLRFCQSSNVPVDVRLDKKAPAIGRSDLFALNQTEDVTMPATRPDLFLIVYPSWVGRGICPKNCSSGRGKKTARTLKKP